MAQTTERDREAEAILRELARLGGNLVQEDALIYTGTQMILPETMRGDIDGAIKYLRQYKEQQETVHRFERTFKYRPHDGANAFNLVLKQIWGSTGIGQTTYSFFSQSPPTYITIDVGINETRQVPWEQILFPPLNAIMFIGGIKDPELGPLFQLTIDAPRKFRGHIEGLFLAVEKMLQENSIYKSKAINGASTPGFFDPFRTDASKVIYADDVLTQLRANIWSLLEHTDTMRALKMPLKRTVLIEGQYGTGKTLAANLTAQRAISSGWTFVQCRPGTDPLEQTMKTALLYAPAVVFFEDIDVLAESGEQNAISRLLDLFDGITAKGAELVCVLTTNHVDRIAKPMLRPGRMDAVISIGALDGTGFKKLIEAVIPEHLREELDQEAIAAAYQGYLPAFAKEAIDRAMRYAIDRTDGKPEKLTTQDFVEAADGLRAQYQLMNDAGEAGRPPTLDQALTDTITRAIDGVKVIDVSAPDYAPFLLKVAERNGQDVLLH